MLFERSTIDHLLGLQKRSYGLLRWLGRELQSGHVSFSVVHGSVSSAVAADEWLIRNFGSLPHEFLPARTDIPEFAHLFASYLTTSFDLPEKKQPVFVSSCGCSCPYCSYVVSAHRFLVVKQPGAKDRQRADRLKRICLGAIADDMGFPLEPEIEKAILSNAEASLELSHAAYVFELLRRTEYESQGAAVLALWRSIAWGAGNRPRKGYRLTSDRVMRAEANVRSAVERAIEVST